MTCTFFDQRTEDNEFDIEDNLDELSESENSTISDKYEVRVRLRAMRKRKMNFAMKITLKDLQRTLLLWKKTFIKCKLPLRPKMKNDSIRKKKCKLKLAIIEFL